MSSYLPSKKRHFHSISVAPFNINSKKTSMEALDSEDTKLDDEGIFAKLLRPPSGVNLKMAKQPRKYEPKFKKPDVENLIQESNILKVEKLHDKKVIMGLKLKIQEIEKKVKRAEGVNTEFMRAMDKEGNSSVYIEILKKKMHDLNVKNISAEAQLRELKKLPSASIYEENSIEKQYLLSETIRLKAILTSLEYKEQEKSRFQDQFLRMLKQENEKLKATIRMLQNDKILLKSRQSIQAKVANDLKKQIQQLKQKQQYKESEIEKLNNENKDLLFKKASQFQKQQERRESEQIELLSRQMQQLKVEKKKIMDVNCQLQQDHHILKEKEKLKSAELLETQHKYEMQIKSYLEQLQQLQFQNGNYKNDYYNLLNTETLKKKKSKSPIVVMQQAYYKPVKLDELQIAFFSLGFLISSRALGSLQELFPEDQASFKCSQLISIFQEHPLDLNKKEAMKLARYLVEDNTHDKVPYEPSGTVDRSLAITIIKTGLTKLEQCQSARVIERWKMLLLKAKKLVPALESQKSSFISRSKFCEMLSKNIRSQIQKEEIQFVIMRSFSKEETDTEIMMQLESIIRVLNQLLNPFKPPQ